MSDRIAMLEESREAKDSRDRLRQNGFVRKILAPTDLTSYAKKTVNYAAPLAPSSLCRSAFESNRLESENGNAGKTF
jgi:hypothetical protein